MTKYLVKKQFHVWIEIDADDVAEATRIADEININDLSICGRYYDAWQLDFTDVGPTTLLEGNDA